MFFRGAAWDETKRLRDQPGLDGHIDFIRRFRDRGVVIEAGPLHDPESYVSDPLVGLALLDMDSLEEARALIENDPVVETGAYTYRVYEWGGPTPLRT